MKTKHEIFIKLATVAPSISFSVYREVDEFNTWDGDGPDPAEEGYEAFNVTASAKAVLNGEIVEGKAHLGGSYYLPSEPIGEVHGYLWQMLEEAAQELEEKLPPRTVHGECVAAQRLLCDEMRRNYEAQMQPA